MIAREPGDMVKQCFWQHNTKKYRGEKDLLKMRHSPQSKSEKLTNYVTVIESYNVKI